MFKQTKYKGVIVLIKSGFVGALGLTGVFILLVIASQGSPTAISLVEAIFKTAPSILGLFILISGIGFILGVIFGQRFPVVHEGILPLVIALIMLAVPSGFVAWVFYKASMQLEYPAKELKLTDCTNNVVNIHLKLPRGHAHQLELKAPEVRSLPSNGNAVSSYRFAGRLRISSAGVQLANLPISSDKAWLTSSGYVLTGAGLQNTNVPPLSNFIHPNRDYDLEINFEPAPPTNASIWLYWRESKVDQ